MHPDPMLFEPPVPFDLHALCARLFPLPRSITGDGVRQTLTTVGETIAAVAPHARLQVAEVDSGTPVFDWTVPREWNVDAARLRDPAGRVVVDFADHNLHLVGYSVPMRARMSLEALRPHLHSLPEQPDLIPYRTSYYQDTWGFCLPDRVLQSLPDGEYSVEIDTRLEPGSLSLGELFLPGETEEEVLVCTHVCHPSLANDNLSGIAVGAGLAATLAGRKRRLSYRFLFIPATVGAVAWLATNQAKLKRIRHALVLSNLGDKGPFHYKASRDGVAALDRAFAHLFATDPALAEATVEPFTPYGYDERQFNSPGIAIPAGCLMRTPFGRYPEYHTSADNLEFVSERSLQGSLALCLDALDIIDADARYLNTNPMCEPQLGKRGLYDNLGGQNDRQALQLATLWILNLSDGRHGLLDIAERARMPFSTIHRMAAKLHAAGLLRPLTESPT